MGLIGEGNILLPPLGLADSSIFFNFFYQGDPYIWIDLGKWVGKSMMLRHG